jgi:hypothetical protein
MSDPNDPPAGPFPTLGQTPHEPTVRPWELELLISGALVFSMVQLPGQLDAWFERVYPGLDGGFASAAFLVWIYLKLALYAVTGGFILHLSIRAYWVGVIGLEAVFPGGIVWEKTRTGPILREVQRQSTPSLQALIDGADRLASLVFAGGFTLALLFGFSLLLAALVSALVYGTVGLAASGVAAATAVEMVIILLVAPIFVATLIDRRYGDRLDPHGRAAGFVRGVGRSAVTMSRYALFQPLMLTILTNLRGQRRISVLFVLLGMGGVVFAGRERIFTGRGLADGYTYLPDGGGRLEVDPRFYEDKREAGEVVADVPSIQSDIVRDPYVRLFIPYRPRRHNELLANGCAPRKAGQPRRRPAAPPHPATAHADSAVLACMARLQPVALNGRPVAVPFRFYTQPGSGVRGIAAYIPVAGLPRGENLLSVGRLPPRPEERATRPPPPFAIPFWL